MSNRVSFWPMVYALLSFDGRHLSCKRNEQLVAEKLQLFLDKKLTMIVYNFCIRFLR